jgi:hypothetical protein
MENLFALLKMEKLRPHPFAAPKKQPERGKPHSGCVMKPV